MKVLVIEDDRRALSYLQRGLQENGCVVDTAENGIDGLFMAQTNGYDVIVLDGMLPGLDGYEIVTELRKEHSTPVIMLTARDGVADRVQGLHVGADDYLVKPYSFVELLARLQALVRRSQAVPPASVGVQATGAGKSAVVPGNLCLGDLMLDPVSQRVTRSGSRIALTAKEFLLMSTFLRRQGQVLSKTALAELVWDIHFDSDLNVVEAAIKRLRSKIDEGYEPRLLHTVRGMGYVCEIRSSTASFS